MLDSQRHKKSEIKLIVLDLRTLENVRNTKELAIARNKALKKHHGKNAKSSLLQPKRAPPVPNKPALFGFVVPTRGGLMSLPSLDYSFRGLESVTEIRRTRPRNTARRSASGRFWSSTLKLNNNLLVSIDGISDIVNQVFQIPENLTWLDLSFNRLRYISSEISHLRTLKIIYLHGNSLTDFPAVISQLKWLPQLYSLTLHGNPIEEKRGYRNRVITQLPQLKSLDFTNVTNSELEAFTAITPRTNVSNASSSR